MRINVFHITITVVGLLKVITAPGSESPNGLKEAPGTIDYHLQHWLWHSFWAAFNRSPFMKFCDRHVARSVTLKLKSD